LLACSQPSSGPADEHTVVYGSSRSALGGMLHEKATEVLRRVGPFAEDSLYSCLLHGLLQGLIDEGGFCNDPQAYIDPG
jgi:hypothetical protein